MNNKLIFSSWHCIDRVKYIDRGPCYLIQVDFQGNHYASHSLEGLHLHTVATVTCFRDDITGCHVASYTFQPQKEIICENLKSLISAVIVFSRQKPGWRDAYLLTWCELWLVEFWALFHFLSKSGCYDRIKWIGCFRLMGACFLH